VLLTSNKIISEQRHYQIDIECSGPHPPLIQAGMATELVLFPTLYAYWQLGGGGGLSHRFPVYKVQSWSLVYIASVQVELVAQSVRQSRNVARRYRFTLPGGRMVILPVKKTAPFSAMT
jgi:hypothetical protein